MKKETIKKISKPFLFPLAVGIIAWEELIYKPIKAIGYYLEKNKVIHKISDKIRHANPYVALGILVCAGLPLIPFKMAGLYLVGHGYTVLGLGTFGLAKIVGGAISMQLFNLTEPAIRKIDFVNRALNWTFDKKDKIKKVITDSEHYQMIYSHVNEFKAQVKELVVHNKYVQQIKNKFTKNKKPTLTSIKGGLEQESTIIFKETTIVSRIYTKVDDMSHSLSSMVDEPVVVIETVEKEVIVDTPTQKEHDAFKQVGTLHQTSGEEKKVKKPTM